MLTRARLFGSKTRVTFSLPLDHPPGVVSVVGDFNGWEPGRHELLPRRRGIRTISVILPSGAHRFRYLATGGLWLDDEMADHIDEHGSQIFL
ncbi:1,4-alpha-glucan branching enzyme [Thermocatellispora tengchongensis]|uniref:1,4-alpha-glucan branching enzyme n=1 Tax=Thermocatellispora tengchongensis TaxID=1073253 RepID=A0A840PGY6_9ACTN|nr:isoamylase early set domain-containing protein [Thermocatellispora tengchongensis]MBB5137091.1 1,4-alpha-glucan branching enzyme [Thermocatellispora tengchongensis]